MSSLLVLPLFIPFIGFARDAGCSGVLAVGPGNIEQESRDGYSPHRGFVPARALEAGQTQDHFKSCWTVGPEKVACPCADTFHT